MQCDTVSRSAFKPLPAGYSFRLCKPDEIEIWKRLLVEEQYVSYVTEYYNKVYANHEDDFFRRCLFACNEDDTPISTCFIWRSYGLINTIGWYGVSPAYEGKGIGRAILTELLKDAQVPIYLHTQPTSARAIKLYSDFGFKLLTDPIIGHRKNDLTESLPILQKILPITGYTKLQYTQATKALLVAALTTDHSEF